MVLELEEDLLHLEGGKCRLDQDRCADGPAGDAQRVLRVKEDIVPEPSLEVALEFRQVEIGTAAAAEKFACVVEEVEPEIEQAGGDRCAGKEHVFLAQVPAAWTHDEGGNLARPAGTPVHPAR